MAAIAFGSCCSIISSTSNLRISWLKLETRSHCRGNVVAKRANSVRSLAIRAEVKFVNADEAKELIAEGYTIIDVRDTSQYDRAHIKSCYHVPLFVKNEANDIGTIVLRQLHNNFSGLFYGIPFTKPNPDFVQSVKGRFSPESKLLLVCQEGLRGKGLEPLINLNDLLSTLLEFRSMGRSTAAASKLEQAGFQDLACITSGLQKVKPGVFDTVGSTELKDAGKAGLVTIQGKISTVLGTVLVCAYLFITFFPDQAEKLLQLAPTG